MRTWNILILFLVLFCDDVAGTPTLQPLEKSNIETLQRLGLEIQFLPRQGTGDISVRIKDTKKFRRGQLTLVFELGDGKASASWKIVPGTEFEAQFTLPDSALSKCLLMLSTSMEGSVELELYDDVYSISLQSFRSPPRKSSDEPEKKTKGKPAPEGRERGLENSNRKKRS